MVYAQSPHERTLKLDCSVCHNSNNWSIKIGETKFQHETTGFSLEGQHALVNCRSCHQSLIFKQAESDCNTCHVDIHQETVGLDCSICHTPKSWMVEDINGLHQRSRFPLVGQHLNADCASCHSRYVDLYFEVLDNDCYSCHELDYVSTTTPNHTEAGFSTECSECHAVNAETWSTTNIVHDFFPLIGGHALQDCFSCHTPGGDYTGLSQECFSCHEQDYNSVEDPNHIQNNFSTDCTQCHTIFGWEPTTFNHNQTNFPLTGAHISVDCSSCHIDGFAGTPIDCYACHQQDYESVTDPNHVVENFTTDCIQCHTTNDWAGAEFDHNLTNFPLTGSHIIVDCSACHTNGYSGTPTECYLCHQSAYEQSINPSHTTLVLPTNCKDCHTTDPNWQPASFPIHGQYYQLFGAHNIISEDCNFCHNGDYNNTPNTCFGCHEADYNATTDPPHQSLNFSQDCIECHNQTSWVPANFDHDGQYFPIYTGIHAGKWDLCSDCHNVPNNYSVFSCITCHEHSQSAMDPKHLGIDGYTYESTACFSCHPTGEREGAFNHDLTNFPLTGAHTVVECQLCHQLGYAGTPTICSECHHTDFQQAANPDHVALALSTDCESCHTTNPNWQPASFDIHDQFYPLVGAHQQISNDCNSCHNGDYNNTSNQCFTCHQSDYNSAPDHLAQSFPTNCEICHNFNVWNETSFNHENTNFPLTGAHQTVDCTLCHQSGYTGTSTICSECHQSNFQQAANPDHVALALPTDCESCHTTDPSWQPASFPIHGQYYQFFGAHNLISEDCNSCHNGDYNNTPNTCFGCHEVAYNATTDPPHQSLNFSQDCMECHNQTGWIPANYNHNFYSLSARHDNVNCNECHSEPGYQPQCLDCHQGDFQNGHNSGDPTDCWNCHSTSNWDTGIRGIKIERTR